MTLDVSSTPVPALAADLLDRLGVSRDAWHAGTLLARSPISGEALGQIIEPSASAAEAAIDQAHAAFLRWRLLPAPRRGELVRLFGEELRTHREALAALVTLEAGKIVAEGLGEVQEMIDICDFAVGLSRQLHGLTIATERPDHRMMETWHPLGVTGVISAFNFPVAVWSWNAALALVCGNSVVWKPSEKTPLTALAVQALFERARARFGPAAPDHLSVLLPGGPLIGNVLVEHRQVPLVSATGSSAMGRIVGPRLAARFARALLELGGNNAAIVAPSADLDLALRAIAFAAMGTAGQRCTSLRRLIVHRSLHAELLARLRRVFAQVEVGDPRRAGTLVGPLIDAGAWHGMQAALVSARALGAEVSGGERVEVGGWSAAFYARPALVALAAQQGPMLEETFAPILYVVPYDTFEEAIALQNGVAAGLSSAIFTLDLREAECFLSAAGSDCGIANVNIGPSGAEIGGAFGGEKETGGGREAGSDAWRIYMRRATNTINYGRQLPLAQGVRFDIAD
jgi:aldehyde dehydrogenase (NAD+)